MRSTAYYYDDGATLGYTAMCRQFLMVYVNKEQFEHLDSDVTFLKSSWWTIAGTIDLTSRRLSAGSYVASIPGAHILQSRTSTIRP